MRDLIIDPHFKGIIPPLSDEVFSQLEKIGRRNLSKASLITLGLEKARLTGQDVRKTAAKFSGASTGTVSQPATWAACVLSHIL